MEKITTIATNMRNDKMNVSKAPNTNVATNNQDSRTKAQKAVPAALLKQLRATAALLTYDHLFGQPTMSSTSFQRKLYNMYHGHEDLNIVSQLELMYQGQGRYSEMFIRFIQLIPPTMLKLLPIMMMQLGIIWHCHQYY